jgi:serine/threonine protein kinase
MNKLSDPLLGRMIRGYRLQELLESDTITKVYRAQTQELWQTPELLITLLTLPGTLSTQTSEQFIKRFLYEAKRIVRLRHKLLYPLFGYGKQDGYAYLLTPNISGITLETYLEQKQRWSPSEAFKILVSIAKALTYIHSQGLIYQFLNPTNIFLLDSKEPQIAKLNYPQMLRMDGLSDEITALSTCAHLQNIAGGYLGAAEYLAPEVVKGAAPDPRSDIYSLGIILFQLLSGHPPFTGSDYLEVAQMHVCKPLPSIHETEPDIPVALELVLNHALYRNPEHRFQTPEDFVTAYAHVLDGQSQVQKRPRPTPPTESIKTLPTNAALSANKKVQDFEQGRVKVQDFEQGRIKVQDFEQGRIKVQDFEQGREKVQVHEELWEDDSWLNAAGPVHRPRPEKKPEMSGRQFYSSRISLPSTDHKRPRKDKFLEG